jgi:hypothetical protein
VDFAGELFFEEELELDDFTFDFDVLVLPPRI